MNNSVTCPICNREFEKVKIEEHANKCLFLNTHNDTSKVKRNSPQVFSPMEKRLKVDSSIKVAGIKEQQPSASGSKVSAHASSNKVPLAESMRPSHLEDLVGQSDAFGPGSMLRSLLEQNKIPNMILWGPPGCGKTSVANVISNICKEQAHLRFVKLLATMAGINDVKEVIKIAKNEAQYNRHTILFMDEIHRFNKLQQDTFLPHVENGTITLVGATTENPSFSLNNALISRCRVVVMEKLKTSDVTIILERALKKNPQAVIVDSAELAGTIESNMESGSHKCVIERASLEWVAGVCDGDARVALGALELALAASTTTVLTIQDMKNGIKRAHMLYDRKGEEHYNTVSAIHKSIRAGDDNAALYWTTRALRGGEDPLYVARRLVRAACEDIGLADESAIVEAVACLQGCQQIGMPECDVLLAQCAVRLARAPKSREVYCAMKRCQKSLVEAKGPLPPVPLHLRNAPTKLMKQLDYGRNYNLLPKEKSGLTYMPEGMENVNFFIQNGGDETSD